MSDQDLLILGIDPGSRYTGYGLIKIEARKYSYVYSGRITAKGSNHFQRIYNIYSELCTIIQKYKPQAAAIEEVFLGKNANSAIKLGQARGAAIVALQPLITNISEYSPRVIKQQLTGYGNADKNQVKFMIHRLLNLEKLKLEQTIAEDESDALAIAICHAQIQYQTSPST
jgi:crossover junction endodeoxyribonuclease RuvC